MARTDNLSNYLTDIATAIKNKKGDNTPIRANSFDTEITNLPSGGGGDINEYIITNANTSYIDLNNTDVGIGFKLVKKLEGPIDATNITNGASFFAWLTNITKLPTVENTSHFTSFAYFFNRLYKVTSLPLIDTSNGTYFTEFARYCSLITEIPQYDFSNGENLAGAFRNCSKLQTIPRLNFQSATAINNLVNSSNKLENLGGFQNLGMAYLPTTSANYSNYELALDNATLLTHDSLVNVINDLYDIAGAGCNTQKLTLGATNVAKLTAEEIASCTSKGWTLS